jgi:hypothetical protein
VGGGLSSKFLRRHAPGIAVRRTASLPLAYARASTSFFTRAPRRGWPGRAPGRDADGNRHPAFSVALCSSLRGALATKQSSFRSMDEKLDCFAEPVIGRRFAPIRWLAMTQPQLICPTGKSANLCPAPFAKIFRFASDPNHSYIHHRLVPLEGRFAVVTNAGRDAVDADSAIDERHEGGRRSRVVLTPRRWCQVGGAIC